MADLNAFRFRPGHSLLHRLDPRAKLLLLVGLSIACALAGPPGLLLLSGALVLLWVHLRLPFWSMLRDLRVLFVLLLFVFVARALATPGDILARWGGLEVTLQGVQDGGVVCWRLMAVVVLGLLFTASTKPSLVRAGVERLLAPIPLVPHQQAGTMIGLLVRFIPVVLALARETGEAQRARGVERRRNPLSRLHKLCIPLLRRVFLGADELALAMEARCWGGVRTGPDLSMSHRDWLALAGGGLLIPLLVLAG
jgi:energy-coupling factor transporter transmembrane protein EcfT